VGRVEAADEVMEVRFVGDVAEESGVAPIIFRWSGPTRQHFLSRDFGPGLRGLGVVLICQNSRLNLKRRVRFAKKEKKLYVDIMLDLDETRSASQEFRTRIVAERLAQEVPEIICKYSMPDFDRARFIEDFKSWIREISTNPTSA
jgi:hypothetical protein